ncbi:hypothetical protein ACFL45_03280 [Candidatus Neomarinimicrobiota bacterium]
MQSCSSRERAILQADEDVPDTWTNGPSSGLVAAAGDVMYITSHALAPISIEAEFQPY